MRQTASAALVDRQHAGRLGWRAREHYGAQVVYDYAQCASCCSLGELPLSGRRSTITDMCFDHVGELLASSSSDGRIAVHTIDQFVHLPRHPGTDGADATAAAVDCEPILCIDPPANGASARSLQWNPREENELLCGFAGGGCSGVCVYDLGGARPGRPARTLRSSKAQGTSALAVVDDGNTVVGGGRDGELRVWDLRAKGAVVRQALHASSGWTVGRTARDCRAGAIHCLAAERGGGRTLHASTDGGCVLTWDARALSTVRSVVRVGARAEGSPLSADAVVPHPTLRHVLAVSMIGGLLSLVDVDTARVLASCDVAAAANPPPGAPPFAPSFGHGGRPAWVPGEEWLALPLANACALAFARVARTCDTIDVAFTTPISAPAAVVATCPRALCLGVGLEGNGIAALYPTPARREAERRTAEEAAEAEAAAAAAAEEERVAAAAVEAWEAREAAAAAAAAAREEEAAFEAMAALETAAADAAAAEVAGRRDDAETRAESARAEAVAERENRPPAPVVGDGRKRPLAPPAAAPPAARAAGAPPPAKQLRQATLFQGWQTRAQPDSDRTATRET